MEAFARRWCECNPDLFVATSSGTSDPECAESVVPSGQEVGREERKSKSQVSDIPYVLAFSMVMLNTDAFNPNAKSKM
jgi:Sec7-like guanine-nucleotide exchange factor